MAAIFLNSQTRMIELPDKNGLASARTSGPPFPQRCLLVYVVMHASDATFLSAKQNFTAAGNIPRRGCAIRKPHSQQYVHVSSQLHVHAPPCFGALLSACIFQRVQTPNAPTLSQGPHFPTNMHRGNTCVHRRTHSQNGMQARSAVCIFQHVEKNNLRKLTWEPHQPTSQHRDHTCVHRHSERENGVQGHGGGGALFPWRAGNASSPYLPSAACWILFASKSLMPAVME